MSADPLAPLCAFAPRIAWAERRANRYALPPDDMGQRVLDAVANFRYFAADPQPPEGVLSLMLSKLAALMQQWCQARMEREAREHGQSAGDAAAGGV